MLEEQVCTFGHSGIQTDDSFISTYVVQSTVGGNMANYRMTFKTIYGN